MRNARLASRSWVSSGSSLSSTEGECPPAMVRRPYLRRRVEPPGLPGPAQHQVELVAQVGVAEQALEVELGGDGLPAAVLLAYPHRRRHDDVGEEGLVRPLVALGQDRGDLDAV